jgi:hypothetical protein
MTAKEKIDNFIGEIPKLEKVNEDLKYNYHKDRVINNAYWQGFYDAKILLRNKLYDKENIPTKESDVVKPDEWSPEFNLTIFEKHIYEQK